MFGTGKYWLVAEAALVCCGKGKKTSSAADNRDLRRDDIQVEGNDREAYDDEIWSDTNDDRE